GAELATVGGEDPVRVAEDRAGAQARPGAAVEDLHPPPVATDVDKDPVALRLSVEAGAARPEGDRNLARPGVVEDLRDVPCVASHDDRLGQKRGGAGGAG